MVTGTDLVVEQIRIAAGERLSKQFHHLTQRGHAVECRIYAEDGENNFFPSSGPILHYSEPTGPGVRVDSGIQQGVDITIDYDPIMAKLIVHAPTRDLAIARMITALSDYKMLGVRTSKRFMIDCLQHPEFIAGRTYTNFIETHMADRSPQQSDELRNLAVALAGASAMTSSNGSGQRMSGTMSQTPWNSLGTWQVGSSIHE
jgi:acetyl/propionyl-CoA carboxylase alpha subunit